MWPEVILLLGAFLVAVVLILFQGYPLIRHRGKKVKEVPDDRVVEMSRSSDQVFRRIEEAVSKKGELTVDELSEIVLSDESNLEFRGESLKARLQEMDGRITATLEEMNKRTPPERK